MRSIIHLNHGWRFKKCSDISGREVHSRWERVDIPHTNKMLPYNCFNEEDYQFISEYRKDVFIQEDYRDKALILFFQGVMAEAEVYINGEFASLHKGGYTPFEVDIRDKVNFGEENEIKVIVDSREKEDIPPFGGAIDYLTYGGIYREVSLGVFHKTYIKRGMHSTEKIGGKWRVQSRICIYSGFKGRESFSLKLQLWDEKILVCSHEEKITIHEKGESEFNISMDVEEALRLWELDDPALYNIYISLIKDNNEVDLDMGTIGFRTAEFRADGFFLNGQRIKLVGLNRHQSYPYVGYAMPKRVQRKDADILKYELGLNMVRTSHYPQSPHFLERCDEIGLLVFEEIPGWQHIGDEQWRENSIISLKEMILRDFNHPSIVLWGVRINESQDHHHFYSRTNKVAEELDPSRQRGGVRYITGSEFLEDVFTMNDFVHSGGEEVLRNPREVTSLDRDVPYLVTECNGHMFPTKRFDTEERLVEHAERHARIMDRQLGDDAFAGALSWCAFDYNTHSDFGSGDKICYHGVMDMFRIPKYAGHFYKSQIPPERERVMELASLCSKGEKNQAQMLPITIYTNCEYIEVRKGEESLGVYPPSAKYRNIPYPPVEIKDMKVPRWGDKDSSLTFIGFIKGEEVIRKTSGGNIYLSRLEVAPDNVELKGFEETYDATRIVLKSVDQYGNILPFSCECVRVEIDGPGEILGPGDFPLIGGVGAFWVRTRREEGIISLWIKSINHAPKKLEIKVVL